MDPRRNDGGYPLDGGDGARAFSLAADDYLKPGEVLDAARRAAKADRPGLRCIDVDAVRGAEPETGRPRPPARRRPPGRQVRPGGERLRPRPGWFAVRCRTTASAELAPGAR